MKLSDYMSFVSDFLSSGLVDLWTSKQTLNNHIFALSFAWVVAEHVVHLVDMQVHGLMSVEGLLSYIEALLGNY